VRDVIVAIRRATLDDAAGIAAVLNDVVAERDYTILDGPFSTDAERAFLASLPARSAVFVPEREGAILGAQSIDLFSAASTAMGHVGTMGTWIRHDARGRGFGRRLAEASLAFAREHAYSKLVVQVLASNSRALAFYRALGFTDIGIARAHVFLNGALRDEIYLEKLLG
jgi:L-amino acid N-acyltransferase YncA